MRRGAYGIRGAAGVLTLACAAGAGTPVRAAAPSQAGGPLLAAQSPVPPLLPGPAPGAADARRECALCHVSWLASFQRMGGAAVPLLMDRPAESSVSASESCLGCHDGAVADSRRQVWLEHGHKTGVEPPPQMKVPDVLPLDEGRIACRTCHTAHGRRGPENLANTVFVRVPNAQSQLCVLCHPEKTKGPELGTHPVGGMPFPVPEVLIQAGAKVGPDPARLICQTCHTPHGAARDDLLVLGYESSQLCLACHTRLRPGMWRPDVDREHPQNPPLTSPVQLEAIHAMGTRVGQDNTLICLSCHKLHHGQAGRYMLADTLSESNLCVRCHPDRREMFGTVHDLRTSAPQERNRLGQTPEQSGPCGACHTFHYYARRPEVTPADPTGLCATCHRPGAAAADATGLPVSHPVQVPGAAIPPGAGLHSYPAPGAGQARTLACLTCHDPHEAGHRGFLRRPPPELCSACHSDYAQMRGGPHDFARRPQATNARGRTPEETGTCGFCHAVHNALGPKMWVATPDAPSGPAEYCTACHGAGGMAQEHRSALLHPMGPQTVVAPHMRTTGLPLYPDTKGTSEARFLSCGTCHDPHAPAGRDLMLRQGPDPAPPESLCILCHREVQHIETSLHGRRFVGQAAGSHWTCGPCHATHEKPGLAAVGMWTGPLGPPEQPAPMRQCTGCHGPGGTARTVAVVEHPAVPMQNVVAAGEPGFLPLLGESGRMGPEGRIVCLTCHVPHGRQLDPPAGAETAAEPLRATKPMVRPYVAPNVCTNCHGFDGLRRYLYYHDTARRGPVPGSELNPTTQVSAPAEARPTRGR